MKIADLAKEFGMTHRALRFYEGRGLLAPSRAGRQRVYSDKDRRALRLISRLSRMGFTLEEIKQIIARGAPVVTDEMRVRQLALMQERLQETAAGIGMLEALDECRGRVDLLGNVTSVA